MTEFIDWIAYFQLEEEDRRRQKEDAEDLAEAQRVARQLR